MAAADAMANNDGRYMNDIFIKKHGFGSHLAKPKILVDLTYTEAALDAGKNPAQTIKDLVGKPRFYGTRCSRMAILSRFGASGLPPNLSIENCLHEEILDNPQDCLNRIMGAENPRAYVYATKTNMGLAERVHGLPVLTLTDEAKAMYLAPTNYQEAFARDTPDSVIKMKKKGEQRYMTNWIKRSKKRGF